MMRKINLLKHINISLLKKITENIYEAAGIPVGIIAEDGTIIIEAGWQDICTNFHRKHPDTCKNCMISDQYIKQHLKKGSYTAYKCLNNMWDIGMPIVVAGEHLATVFMGQFFYEDEEIDLEVFRSQALEYGFDEKEYLDALSKVPRFSRKKVEHIMEYYSGLVMTLTESALRKLKYREKKIELEKNKKYLNQIINSVSDAIFLHDVYGNIIDVNETAITMFGYSREELLSINIEEIFLFNSDYIKLKGMLANKAKMKNPLIQEFNVKNKSNDEFWVEANINISNIYGKEIIVAAIRDITERKQAELQLKNEEIELEKLRTEFFANISHELRTPLNILLSAIQLMEMQVKNEEKTLDGNRMIKNINIGKQNCYRLIRLTNNLIDLTKMDSGYLEFKMNNYNIVSIIENITLSVAEYIKSNQLNLVFDTDIEEKIIICDQDIMERIIFNLLSNSIKFTEPGGSIFVNIFDGEEYITITIEDTGIGIPKEKLNLIFERFRQVDRSFRRKNEGSGIGLSLVKSLVELQGGKIYVESKYGIGTKFTIQFPAKTLCEIVEEAAKKPDYYTISNYVDTINVEFSDIYK